MKLNNRIDPRRVQAGFSLIELMVASAVGLILTLAVTGSVLTVGRQFSVLSANVGAQGSAQIALSLMDAAGRSAGAGFFNNGRLICANWNAYNGTAVVSDGAAFMPARIVGGASATASDSVIFTAATGAGALSAVPLVDTEAGATYRVSSGGTLATNDLALVGVPGSTQPCLLIQVGNVSTTAGCGGNATSCTNLVRPPNTGLNAPNGSFSTNPTFGFAAGGGVTGPAVVARVGSAAGGFRQDGFTVQCNSLVRFNSFTTPTAPACTASPLGFGTGVDAIATEIVLMQAQYGISSSGASDIVTSWVEPTGVVWGGSPTPDNVARIKAIRIVLVARSRDADAEMVSAPCTNVGGVANTGPCSFQDAAAPVVDLSATSVAAGRTWRNYRYRVHKAVIPLRNVIWSDS